MEQNVEIVGKNYVLKELKYKDLTEMADLSKGDSAKQMVLLSTGMTEEDYDNLSLKDGIKLQTKINQLNGLDEDFQAPLKD